jgi:preprotein translocase SecE subunit
LQVRVLSPLPLPTVDHRPLTNPTLDRHRTQATTAPAHHDPEEQAETNVIAGLREYLTEAWSELRKVAWPTRQTVINLTLIVLAVSVAVGAYIAVLDLGLHTGVEQVLKP